MTDVRIDFSNIGDRNEVRRRVIEQFLSEAPGTEHGVLVSRHNYFVARLGSGNEVVLQRPENLKSGFYFLIRATNINFNLGPVGRYRDFPKHEKFLNEIRLKRLSNPAMYTI